MLQLINEPSTQQTDSEVETLAAINEAVKSVTEKYDRDFFVRCIKGEASSVELLTALAESGLLGIGVSEEYGGQGGGTVEQTAVLEGLARAGVLSNSFMVANFCRDIVAQHGTDEQRAKFLPKTLDGKHYTSFGLTEPDAGTNSYAMRTTAVQKGEEWRVTGQKTFISLASVASQMLLVARTPEFDVEAGRPSLSLFIVDLPDPAITITSVNVRVSEEHQPCTLYIDDLRLPKSAYVGSADLLFDALNRERILAAAQVLGYGVFALEKAVTYSKHRAPFGRTLGSYQVNQHRFARSYIGLSVARTTMYDAARAYDAGNREGLGPSAAKLLTSEAAEAAVDALIQVHGGHAFDMDNDVLRLWDFARLTRIAPVNNETVLDYIARKGLGFPRA